MRINRLALLPVLLVLSCTARNDERTRIEFWGFGREGEEVAKLVPEFHRRNPDIRIDVQQIPWTAAHEKLLTAHVGESFPDITQMGNTWVPEFETIGAIEALDPWVARSTSVRRDDYFDGIWQTNVVDGMTYGLPWYIDTRVIFYRRDLLARAGFNHPPSTWSEWMLILQRLKEQSGRRDFYPILLPANEWPPPTILALQSGAKLIGDDATARFSEPAFINAFNYYLDFFRRGYASVQSHQQVSNLYQQFGAGEFVMFITGPWNVGEMRKRLPEDMQGVWSTAPMPARDGAQYPGVSLAGGSSLVLSRSSQKKEAAWKFIEFLSEPAQQVRFYELSGDLPARKTAWNHPLLANDEKIQAFRVQFDHTVPTPTIPEWEYIATTIFEHAETAARGRMNAQQAAASLDQKVNRILEKRRWIVGKTSSRAPKSARDLGVRNLPPPRFLAVPSLSLGAGFAARNDRP